MRRGMSKPRGLKVGWNAARLIDINEYLAYFPGAALSEKIVVTELNEILINSMPNSWIKQAYVQFFYWKSIDFKESVKMFECMDISESIYEGVEEPSY